MREASVRKGSAAVPTQCWAPAAGLVRGAVRVEEVSRAWVRPWRVYPQQLRALESCLAWYPGVFRQMASCTAGVRLEFETDSSEVRVEVRVDEEPTATRRVLEAIDGRAAVAVHTRDGHVPADAPSAALPPHDGISADVDGRHLAARMPEPAPAAGRTRDEWGPSVTFGLEEGASGDLLQLPGFGETHRVRVWLPALRGCELGRVAGNGTFVRPVEDEGDGPRGGLVVLGDSVAQGFVCEDPAMAWPSLVSSRLGLPLVNQSIGAQVFQPSSLMGLEALPAPEVVVVALGANYRYGRCSERVVSREVADLLFSVDRLWPEAGLVVVLPAPAGDRSVARGSCYESVPGIVEEAVGRLRSRRVAAGHAAVVLCAAPELSGEELLADADGHPTPAGSETLAEAVCDAISALECRCLRDFGVFGRCGACVKAPEPEEGGLPEAPEVEPEEPLAEPDPATPPAEPSAPEPAAEPELAAELAEPLATEPSEPSVPAASDVPAAVRVAPAVEATHGERSVRASRKRSRRRR